MDSKKKLVIGLITASMLSVVVFSALLYLFVTRGPYELAKYRAESGDAEAQYRLGAMLEWGEGVDRNPKEAMKWYEKSAKQGNYYAQSALGHAYLYPDRELAAKNVPVALKWLERAAVQGEPGAQRTLGILYFRGEDMPLNYPEALRWFEKASQQGDSYAQAELALMLMEGKGTTRNCNRGKKIYELLLSQEEAPDIMNRLGEMHRRGICANVDYKAAMDWYLKAEDAWPNPATEVNIGYMHRYGLGVAKDPEAADHWFRKAVKSGEEEDYYTLGKDFYYGETVAPDPIEGAMWLQLAADRRHEEARKLLARIDKELTKEQQAAARERARKLNRKNISRAITSP